MTQEAIVHFVDAWKDGEQSQRIIIGVFMWKPREEPLANHEQNVQRAMGKAAYVLGNRGFTLKFGSFGAPINGPCDKVHAYQDMS